MNPSQLVSSAFNAHIDDARRHAQASRRAKRRARADRPGYAEHVVIRSAGPGDDHTLRDLAALDSARVPAGGALVAEVGGRVVAAIELATGRSIADPFQPTADVVSLLEMRLLQFAGAGDRKRRGRAFALAPRRSATGSLG